MITKFTLKPDKIDFRDLPYIPTKDPLADIVDLRKWASPVEDQGQLGSCTSNALVGGYELITNRDEPTQFIDLSRLFVYYNERVLEESVDFDAGATIRDSIKSVKQYGICSESLWPYNIDYFTITPSVDSYNDAKHRNIKEYFRVADLNGILDALNHDHPITVGILVYSGFDDLNQTDTILKSPKDYEFPLGGHAVCLVGYDLSRKLVLARNSYGPDWCMEGYFWMTFDYIIAELMDAWIFNIDLIP